MPSPNLQNAAGESFNNLQVKWLGNNLKSALTAFWQATINTFPEQDVNGHPVANWLAVISSLATNMPAAGVPYDQLTMAADYVYRLCWMTEYLAGAGLITAVQASTGPNSILVQYNATLA
jgi:hypothetical protein